MYPFDPATPPVSLSQLLEFHDEQFIRAAYEAVLGRQADSEGFTYYLSRLRSGVGKVEILSQLHHSPEGARRKQAIPGLEAALHEHRWLRVPVLGVLLRLLGWGRQDDTLRRLRAIENLVNTYGHHLQFQLTEISRAINHLNQLLAEQQGGGRTELREVAAASSSPAVSPKPYDPIGDRYQAALKEIGSRLTPASVASTPAEKSSGVKISVLMPVYKVPLQYLDRAISSVRYQTHENWELCIVDDGSNDASLTGYLLRQAASDPRIKVEISAVNGGISAATNKALALASADFVALLDNDDMLTNDALAQVSTEIMQQPEVDLVYSDECKIDESDSPVELFTKPDWSPLMLLNCMYTGHLSVYRKVLVEKLGGFRTAYNFSQDYDLALRASETARLVRHIPRVLYGWRMIAGSGSQGDKPHARLSNVAALQDAADRRGIRGKAVAETAANHLRVEKATMVAVVSIVIPSDNLNNILATIKSIHENTEYQYFEIIVVTNSKLIAALKQTTLPRDVLFAAFDKPFNFSEKCNVGAALAGGDFILFFNDDVRVVSRDWIEMILECFVHPYVGVVGPKLLYENYLIQHAGMISGVRGLVGTAFHCLPHETSRHFGMALWVREVSLICGACLAIRADVFNQIQGFDAENAPISHSDVDLCFRVREAGFSCVYTPHATLIHIGHLSIGEEERKEERKVVRKKDKSDIFLLRRWPRQTAYDPYFPPAMRDILYHDSPESWQLFADVPPAPDGGQDILLLSHDLSGSGAPRIVYEMACTLVEAGHFVVVASPTDGVFRERLNQRGIPVIVDELLLRQHDSLERFARNFDKVIANTVVTWPAVRQLSDKLDVYWYIHEISLLEHLLNAQPEMIPAFSAAKGVWVGSNHALTLVARYRPDALVLKYGVVPLQASGKVASIPAGKLLNLSLFGSYEGRKGQDLAVAAVAALPATYRERLRLRMFGRPLDTEMYERVVASASSVPEISVYGEIPYEQYRQELMASDVILVASRDDTLPFVSIDALGAGKVLACTSTTGTSAYIEHGKSGFVAAQPDQAAIAAVLREMIDAWNDLSAIALQGRLVFDQEFSVGAFRRAFFDACAVPLPVASTR